MQRNMIYIYIYRYGLGKKTLTHMWCTKKRQILTSFKEMTVKETKKQQTNVTVKPGLIKLGTQI